MYVESSAVLAWLLDEASARDVLRWLAESEAVLTSDLTLIECDRALWRAVALDELTEAQAADRRMCLAQAAARWHVLRITAEVVERARQPFPGAPIRTLDAIHVASALLGRTAIAGLKLLSLDERVRRTGKALGLEIVPS